MADQSQEHIIETEKAEGDGEEIKMVYNDFLSPAPGDRSNTPEQQVTEQEKESSSDPEVKARKQLQQKLLNTNSSMEAVEKDSLTDVLLRKSSL